MLTLPEERFAEFGRRLAALIRDPGAEDTPRQLCRMLEEFVGVDSSSVFLFRKQTAPKALHDEPESGPVGYVDSPYLLDPVYDYFMRGTAPPCCRLRDISPDNFEKSEYYIKYYKHIDAADEYCFNVPVGSGSMVHVSLLRQGQRRRFGKRALRILESLAPVVTSVLTRFSELRAGDLLHVNAEADAFHARLSGIFERFGRSLLTAREKQIVDLTMKGYSDKLTARKLDITPGTVRNHKKSIFSKLKVSSQGQLFGLFLDVLQMPANEEIGPDPLATLLARRTSDGAA